MSDFIRYESYDAFLLYEEFNSIPGNRLTIEIPDGMIVTSQMMHTYIKAAYHLLGKSIISH